MGSALLGEKTEKVRRAQFGLIAFRFVSCRSNRVHRARVGASVGLGESRYNVRRGLGFMETILDIGFQHPAPLSFRLHQLLPVTALLRVPECVY